MPETSNFWSEVSHYEPVTRRILFSFSKAKKLGEIVISIAPEQPICDLAGMGESMLHEAIIEATRLKAHDTITPQLVFAAIAKPHAGETPVVHTGTNREVPVWQLLDKTDHVEDDLSFQAAMKHAHAAMPTALVAPGDYAVGFLVRDEVLHFYPILTISIDEDVASYKEGSASTNDVIPLLPFQS